MGTTPHTHTHTDSHTHTHTHTTHHTPHTTHHTPHTTHHTPHTTPHTTHHTPHTTHTHTQLHSQPDSQIYLLVVGFEEGYDEFEPAYERPDHFSSFLRVLYTRANSPRCRRLNVRILREGK